MFAALCGYGCDFVQFYSHLSGPGYRYHLNQHISKRKQNLHCL